MWMKNFTRLFGSSGPVFATLELCIKSLWGGETLIKTEQRSKSDFTFTLTSTLNALFGVDNLTNSCANNIYFNTEIALLLDFQNAMSFVVFAQPYQQKSDQAAKNATGAQ